MVGPERTGRRQKGHTGGALLVPASAYLALAVAVPLVLTAYLSTTSALSGTLSGPFVGLDNFFRALRDPTVLRAARNTVMIAVVSQTAATAGAVVLANVLVRPFRGRAVFLFLVVLPWAAPVALATLGWRWILDSLFSVLTWGLRAGHLIGAHDNPQWLGEPGLALASVMVVEAWRALPFATVVIMAGLASLPRDLDDAARIDGAHGWRKWRHVTLPLLAPAIAVTMLIGIVLTMSGMAIVSVLTGGGPLDSTQVISSWAFRTGITSGELGSGAAVALLSLPVAAVASVLVLRAAQRAEPGL